MRHLVQLICAVLLPAIGLAGVDASGPTRANVDVVSLQGEWEMLTMDVGGRQIGPETIPYKYWEFGPTELTFTDKRTNKTARGYTFHFDTLHRPAQIGITMTGYGTHLGLCHFLNRDTLIMSLGDMGAARPERLESTIGTNVRLYTFRRVTR
jgi:uncharacterized protein (TIGR03067 family)